MKAFAAWLGALDSGPLIVRSDGRHQRRCERGGVQKRGKDRAAAVTEEVKGRSGFRRGIKLRCRESAQDNEARATCQVPVERAGGKDGETLRVAPYQFQMKATGRTAFCSKTGTGYKREIVEFAEQVLFHISESSGPGATVGEDQRQQRAADAVWIEAGKKHQEVATDIKVDRRLSADGSGLPWNTMETEVVSWMRGSPEVPRRELPQEVPENLLAHSSCTDTCNVIASRVLARQRTKQRFWLIRSLATGMRSLTPRISCPTLMCVSRSLKRLLTSMVHE